MTSLVQYTFTAPATVAFDIDARSEVAAKQAAQQVLNRLRQGVAADEFLQLTTSGYIRADADTGAVLADTYTPKN